MIGSRQFREIMSVITAETSTHRHLRDRVTWLTTVTVVIDLVASVIAWLLERGGRGTQIHHWGDALFWTTTQLLTPSSQLPNPVTPAGRVLDVFLEWYGITVVAALAGSFGSFFHRRGMELDPMPTQN